MLRWCLPATVLIVLLHFSAGDDNCYGFVDTSGVYRPPQECPVDTFCCGNCNDRYCCNNSAEKLNEDNACPSGETCNLFMNKAGYFIPLSKCPPNYYCCGTCDNRTCCTSKSASFDQTRCPTTPGDTCASYTDSGGNVQPARACNAGEYCCGKCNNRYCCTAFTPSLNQLNCPESQETCSAFIDSAGNVQPAQTCSQVQYCCGTCNNRTCCSVFPMHLKQNTCPGEICGAHTDDNGVYQRMQYCSVESSQPFCCGTCGGRFCCSVPSLRLSQDSCPMPHILGAGTIAGIIVGVIAFFIVLSVVFCFLGACCCFKGRRQIIQLSSFANRVFMSTSNAESPSHDKSSD